MSAYTDERTKEGDHLSHVDTQRNSARETPRTFADALRLPATEEAEKVVDGMLTQVSPERDETSLAWSVESFCHRSRVRVDSISRFFMSSYKKTGHNVRNNLSGLLPSMLGYRGNVLEASFPLGLT